jgi:hypothetical protein
MGIIMQQMNNDNPFPPVANPCPDTWKIKGNACVIPAGDTNVGTISTMKDSFLQNTYGISDNVNGIIQPGTSVLNPLNGTTQIDFNNSGWNKSGSSLCSQKSWAKTYGITWDGISNNTDKICKL